MSTFGYSAVSNPVGEEPKATLCGVCAYGFEPKSMTTFFGRVDDLDGKAYQIPIYVCPGCVKDLRDRLPDSSLYRLDGLNPF